MSDSDKGLIWTEGAKKPLLETKIFTVNSVEAISPEGDRNEYYVIDANDWVVVIPVIDDSFLMVKQWRHGSKSLSIEFPGGVVEKGEKAEEGAARELLEETGCKSGRLVHLGTMSPNPAINGNRVHFFAAYDLTSTGKQNLDCDEYINCQKISQKEVCQNMAGPEYQHSLMAAALGLFLIKKSI